MKRSSTRSGPSCSGFWDTVRNNLTIREMTALMGGDSMMEQQTEKDFRFENVNCTPFVRQYGILFRKWGVFVCQRDNESTTERRR